MIQRSAKILGTGFGALGICSENIHPNVFIPQHIFWGIIGKIYDIPPPPQTSKYSWMSLFFIGIEYVYIGIPPLSPYSRRIFC